MPFCFNAPPLASGATGANMALGAAPVQPGDRQNNLAKASLMAALHRLTLSEGTVKMHVAALLKNLGLNNRTRAALKAAGLTPTSVDTSFE